MLPIHINGKELWDEQKEEFYTVEGCDLLLEHSLHSIFIWEGKYKKPYLTSKKTLEESLDYIEMMNMGEPIKDRRALYLLSKEQLDAIAKYTNDPMTATIISEKDEKKIANSKSNKCVTSEEIYSWMCAQQVPVEFQYWHLNRLIVLLKICAINNKPEDKKKNGRMTSAELAARRQRMEEARKKYGG